MTYYRLWYWIGPALSTLAIVMSIAAWRKVNRVRSVLEMDKEFVLHLRLLAEALTVARERGLPVEEWLKEAAKRLTGRDAEEANAQPR